jgi:hypothetical protein
MRCAIASILNQELEDILKGVPLPGIRQMGFFAKFLDPALSLPLTN